VPGKVINVQDDTERARLGLGRYGVILDDNTLLEFSPTSVPANSGAIALLSRSAREERDEMADLRAAVERAVAALDEHKQSTEQSLGDIREGIEELLRKQGSDHSEETGDDDSRNPIALELAQTINRLAAPRAAEVART
jgi:hypothetical protein